MIKSIPIFVLLCLFAMPQARAEQAGTLRDMATQAMFDYAEKLYERHDYREAGHVFQRILTFDPANAGALAYLNKMDLGAIKPLTIQVSRISVPAQPKVEAAAAAPVVVPITASVGPNADLKDEIAVQDRALDQLKEEIHRMRVELGAQG